MKTRNFHWHLSGPHFRDYHLMVDEHASQLFSMTDDITERVRKIGGWHLSWWLFCKSARICDQPAISPNLGNPVVGIRSDSECSLHGEKRDVEPGGTQQLQE
jgi:DNA-binding ferritin-like protein